MTGDRFIEENNQRDEFIKKQMTELDCFQDIDLWESFQEEFVDWTRRDFELASISCCRAFRTYLRRKGVWISKETTSAKSLYDVFKERIPTSWTEDEIKCCLPEMRFTSYVIKSFLKAPSNELLQRQKHEVSIDHEEFMIERYTLISESSLRLPAPLISVNQSGGQPGGQSDEQPDGQSGGQSGEQSENQSISRQSIFIIENSEQPPTIDHSEHAPITENSEHAPTTENLKHPDGPPDESPDGSLDGPPVRPPDGPSVEPSIKPPVGPPVGPPDEPLVEPSDGPSVEQSFKPPTPSPLPAHPSAPPTPINQPGGQPFKPPRPSAPLTPASQPMRRPMGQPMRPSVGQSMGQLMGQLMRRSMNQPISGIHVRCGIE
jgi:hypothetical protein